VEPYEVLKALKALGKKLDEKQFWQKFAMLCGESSSLSYARFEMLMMERLQVNRKEQQRGCRRAPNRNPTSGTKYYDVKAAHGLNSRHKEKLVERLNDAKEIQGMRGAA
jgi:hypothetical protein